MQGWEEGLEAGVLTCKQEDGSSDARTPCKCQVDMTTSLLLQPGKVEAGAPAWSKLARDLLGVLSSSPFLSETLSQKNKVEQQLRKISNTSPGPPHRCTTCTCVPTHECPHM